MEYSVGCASGRRLRWTISSLRGRRLRMLEQLTDRLLMMLFYILLMVFNALLHTYDRLGFLTFNSLGTFQLLVLLTWEEGFQGGWYNDTLNSLHCIELGIEHTRDIIDCRGCKKNTKKKIGRRAK